jgi:hypothetical protein
MKQKVRGKRRPLRRRKNVAASTYTPLPVDRAFGLVLASKDQPSPDELVYSDGVGVYRLRLVELHWMIECSVGRKIVYRKFMPVQDLLPRYKNKLNERLKCVIPLIEAKSKITIASENKGGDGSKQKPNSSLTPAINARADAAANKRFYLASRSQVSVASQLACDDIRFGRSPGHVGDLK